MTSADDRCVLAVHLAGGTAYCAVVSPPDTLRRDPLVRIELAEGLDSTEQLVDFASRFRQELNRLRPTAVGVIQTTKSSNWIYAQAWRRATIEAAIMLTVADASNPANPVAFKQIKPSAMAKSVGIPLPKLQEVATERWGDQVPMYRQHRFPAVVGAMALVKEFCP